MIGADPELPQRLVEHVAVLGRDADPAADPLPPRLERVNERAHLDGLGPRPQDGENTRRMIPVLHKPA